MPGADRLVRLDAYDMIAASTTLVVTGVPGSGKSTLAASPALLSPEQWAAQTALPLFADLPRDTVDWRVAPTATLPDQAPLDDQSAIERWLRQLMSDLSRFIPGHARPRRALSRLDRALDEPVAEAERSSSPVVLIYDLPERADIGPLVRVWMMLLQHQSKRHPNSAPWLSARLLMAPDTLERARLRRAEREELRQHTAALSWTADDQHRLLGQWMIERFPAHRAHIEGASPLAIRVKSEPRVGNWSTLMSWASNSPRPRDFDLLVPLDNADAPLQRETPEHRLNEIRRLLGTQALGDASSFGSLRGRRLTLASTSSPDRERLARLLAGPKMPSGESVSVWLSEHLRERRGERTPRLLSALLDSAYALATDRGELKPSPPWLSPTHLTQAMSQLGVNELTRLVESLALGDALEGLRGAWVPAPRDELDPLVGGDVMSVLLREQIFFPFADQLDVRELYREALGLRRGLRPDLPEPLYPAWRGRR